MAPSPINEITAEEAGRLGLIGIHNLWDLCVWVYPDFGVKIGSLEARIDLLAEKAGLPATARSQLYRQVEGAIGRASSLQQRLPHLWVTIGAANNDPIAPLADEYQIPPQWVRALILSNGAYAGPGAVSTGKELRPNAVMLGLALLLLLGAALTLRAVYRMGSKAARGSTHGEKVVIAARNLLPGSTLREGDLATARLMRTDQDLPAWDLNRLYGCVLTRALTRGLPLHRPFVLRAQVAGARDLLPGSIITRDAVTVAWLPYDDDAAVNIDTIIEHRLLYGLHMGGVVLKAGIENTTYLQQAVKNEPTLTGRQVLTIPVTADVISSTIFPPATVALILAPHDGKSPALRRFDDVRLLAVDRRADATVITVAIKPQDLQPLITLLGATQVLVVRPIPAVGIVPAYRNRPERSPRRTARYQAEHRSTDRPRGDRL